MSSADIPILALLQPGERLAQYQIVRAVGAGGMGVVYLARDVELERDVAIKVLRGLPNEADPDRLRERFLREARSAAKLNHPHVASVHQVGRQGDVAFIAMEWIAGGSLADHLQKQIFLDWREATTAARDAALGLAAAHAAGLVHRDLKPSNLMRTPAGVVKLVDFGLAREHDVPSDLTHADHVLGTPAYLSPEQCRGEPATPLSDLYSLACTWYHLLTSSPPFEAPNVPAMLHQQIESPVPDPRLIAGDAPVALSAVMARAAAKRPADRHPSAEALAADLTALLQGVPPTKVVTPLPRPADTPTNLPAEHTSFIGRENELAETRSLLSRGRLVTLLGAGGTGKTRLACRAGRELASDFPDGVWLVELAPIASGQDVARAAAVAVGARESGSRAPLDAIIDRLRDARSLLILDNCEHLIDGAASVAAAVLNVCPTVRVLATSRQPLRAPGEATLRVPSLGVPEESDAESRDRQGVDSSDIDPTPNTPLPDGRGSFQPSDLLRCDAVRLFVERASAARPSFTLTADNADAVATICRRLDGIPLAIELAAARVKVLSAQQIASRLGDAFRLLTGGSRTLLPRQQTLRALVDWSHDLLSPTARMVLARLSVFAGGCTVESAEAVVADGELEPDRVLDAIGELVDQSLLVADERDHVVRYRMAETVRQYAAEKLSADPGDDRAVRRRHACIYAYLAADAVARLHSPEQAEVQRAFNADQDNFRAALDWSIASHDLDTAVGLGGSLGRLWNVTGQLVEGLRRLEQVIALDPPRNAGLGRLLDAAGVLALYRGEPDKASAWFERALALARGTGNKTVEGAALRNLGTLAKERGDLPRALELTEQSLRAYVAAGDRTGEAGALNNRGIVLKAMGDADGARKFLRASLDLVTQLRDVRWIAYGHLNLAELELELGNPAAAEPLYRKCQEMLREMGEEWGGAYALEGLAKCALARGDLTTAKRQLQQTLAICRRAGDRSTVADTMEQLAEIAITEGDAPSARDLLDESLSLRVGLKEKLGLATSMELRAALLLPTRPEDSAKLLGCAAGQRANAHATLLPSRQTWLDRVTADTRATLGDETFAAAYEAGKSCEPAELLGAPPPTDADVSS